AHGSTHVDWWKQFDDEVLVWLIDTSLNENQDLVAATYRVEQLMGLYRATRSELFPHFYGGGQYSRERISTEVTPVLPGIKNPNDYYQLSLSGSWEIDVWGKLRRATEAACRDLLAAE